jgi:restriction system protein
VALTFAEAAKRVLEEAKRPLNYNLITKRAVERGLISTRGLTPHETMRVEISRNIWNAEETGSPPVFRALGRGVFDLAVRRRDDHRTPVQRHNQQVKDELLRRLREVDPTEFEHLVSRLLAEMGFEDLEVTKRSHDGGIDVRGTLVVAGVVRTRMAIQAKRYKEGNNVGPHVVTQLRGSLLPNEQGLVVTAADFTSAAKKEACHPQKQPIDLMDGAHFVDLLVEHRIGVKREDIAILELDEEDEHIGMGVVEGAESGLDGYGRVPITGARKGQTYQAVLVGLERVEAQDGTDLGSPSGAAKKLTRVTAVNGWRWWHFVDPADGQAKPIDALRGQQDGAGAMEA